MEISRKRVERKRQRAVEKATDPVAAAERRRDRTEAGKIQKRRKVEESAKLRGGTKRMRTGGIGIPGPGASRNGGGRGGRDSSNRGGARWWSACWWEREEEEVVVGAAAADVVDDKRHGCRRLASTL
ncbi:unnamed protein product [Ectocarpus sp. CCAP 1310/34]|nr:unnamed protein product [Ectocarpus sp. CCAP 1310/34]